MSNQTTMTPPAEFICPLSNTLMKEPMMSRYGTHFERKAILEWINKGHNYCPVTGNPLRPSNLVSNKTLQWKITYWAQKNGVKGFETEEQNEEPQLIATAAVPPKHMICPLTRKVMKYPVVTREGQNFERKAIMSKLDKNGDICPVTKKPLRPSGLVPNGKLQWEIRKWQLNFGDATKEMTRLELENKLSKAEMVSGDFQLSDMLRALAVDTGKEGHAEETSVDNPSAMSVLNDALECL
jgi:hypothetical protein